MPFEMNDGMVGAVPVVAIAASLGGMDDVDASACVVALVGPQASEPLSASGA